MDEKFLKRAIHLAKKNSANGQNGPFGAVVVFDNQIVGEGWNQVVANHDPTAHAEIIAMRNACIHLHTNVLDKCILYTSCEPCPMCLAAIYWARISKIFYACCHNDATYAGFDDNFIYQEIGKNWSERSLISKQMLRNEALYVFELWLANPDRIEY